MEIDSKEARKNITLWCFILSATLLLIFIIQTVNGKFEDKSSDAWYWIAPNIFPFLGLVSGGYLLNKTEITNTTVDISYYRLSLYSAIFYYVILLITILSYPWSDNSILEHYRKANIYLAPIQSVVSGLLGLFFVKGNKVVDND
jgi:uncharacterized membrane protein SirB2